MINQTELRAECVRNGYTLDKLARAIGIHRQTMYRKVNGTSEFTCGEMEKICACLHLSKEKVSEIFFTGDVAETHIN